MNSYDLVIALFNGCLSPVPFDPSSAPRGAGVDEGAGGDGANGSGGPRRAGGLWRDPAGSSGSPRVTLKVPFITVFMCPGLSCRDTNGQEEWPEQGPIYKATSTSTTKQRPTCGDSHILGVREAAISDFTQKRGLSPEGDSCTWWVMAANNSPLVSSWLHRWCAII